MSKTEPPTQDSGAEKRCTCFPGPAHGGPTSIRNSKCANHGDEASIEMGMRILREVIAAHPKRVHITDAGGRMIDKKLRDDLAGACHQINLQIDRAEKAEGERDALLAGMREILVVNPGQLAYIVIEKMRAIAQRHLEDK